MILYRDTFDEEKEPEGMVLTGDLASLNTTETAAAPTPALDAPSKAENGHAEEEEEDENVVMVEPAPKAATAGTKRKLENEETHPTEKRLRASEAVPVEV